MQRRGVVVGLALSLVISVGAWARTPVWPQHELEQLLGPIALYPDPVLAQVLPAATAPDDLALAAKFLEDGGDLGQVDAQPWNDNVKALARWPEILRMMNRSRDWADAVGTAFLDQTEDVMKAIQRLRSVAMTSGALGTSDEQRVTAEDGVIYIYPADPSVINLPVYDADRVFALHASAGGNGLVTFGSALLVGYWVHHELDWRKHRLFTYDYREYPFGRRNPWYFGGQVSGQVPANLPEQDNGKWKADKKKRRPRFSVGDPLPTVQVVSAPTRVPHGNEPAPPASVSRPLAAPKDLPLPPPVLTPVDPVMDPVEEAPVKKPPVRPAAGTQKPAAAKPAKAGKEKTAEAIPAQTKKEKASAREKSGTAKAAKEKTGEETTAPAKSRKMKPAAEREKTAEAKTVSGKKSKENPDAAGTGKGKTAEARPSKKKAGQDEAEAKKTAEAKSGKVKATEKKKTVKE